MQDFAALIEGLHGLSIALGLGIGLLGGFLFAMLTYRFYGKNFRSTFERLGDEMKTSYDGVTDEMKASFKSLSSEALADSQSQFLSLADRELDKKTEQHATELESKKELIDTQLQSMSKSMTDTLNTVPTELERNQTKVAEVLDKSAEQIKESNKSYLDQLTEKSETQTKAHNKELETKKELIDQRLTNMDVKLGKVERLVQELQTDRKAQYGALGRPTAKPDGNHFVVADGAGGQSRARTQWGERIAEDILRLLGFVEGVNYVKQATTDDGNRPDFTFRLPNQLSLNMDAKFPLDNYMRYSEADTEADKRSFSDRFLRDVNSRVAEIQKRDYIGAETLDCVLVFIPNEQVYRFIHEQDHSIIDSALRQKVILCSPLTLYIVLAVIRQASQNFNIEQQSRQIVTIVNEIRQEWDKYTGEMQTLSNHFQRVYNNLQRLTVTRTRALDRRFDKIEGLLEDTDLDKSDDALPAPAPALHAPGKLTDELPF